MKLKVRIAVAANAEGEWYAYGYGAREGWDEIMESFDRMDGEQRFWIEAELDIPDQIPVVEGAISSAQREDSK